MEFCYGGAFKIWQHRCMQLIFPLWVVPHLHHGAGKLCVLVFLLEILKKLIFGVGDNFLLFFSRYVNFFSLGKYLTISMLSLQNIHSRLFSLFFHFIWNKIRNWFLNVTRQRLPFSCLNLETYNNTDGNFIHIFPPLKIVHVFSHLTNFPGHFLSQKPHVNFLLLQLNIKQIFSSPVDSSGNF